MWRHYGMTNEPLLTEKQAARRYKKKASTLNKWRAEGKGPRFVRLGSSVFYRAADLDAFIEASVVDPARAKSKRRRGGA
jgi:predicted DNA-binding transcriptional regulator AlpA